MGKGESCRLRFRVLHRRFSGAAAAENVDGGGGEEEVEEPDADAVASWVEELRKLRVAELRREVEKYDLSIGSLQSKLKRLTEEKERSPSGEAEPAVKEETEDDVRKGSPEEEEAGGVEDRVSGHESGRSCKESNSSDLKRPEDEPAAANDDPAEREEAAAGEEGERYSGTIRRHVDLEMVRARLVGGAAAAAATCYASASELYRDLLLLCANALVFFPRGSPEHDAALQVRALVSKHISKDRPPAGKVPAAAVEAEAVASKKPKADADIAGSLLEKAPIIVCRKRSSIAKAAAATAAKGEKAETDKEKDGEDKKKAAVAATVTSKDRKARGMRTNKSRGPARNQKTKVSESGEGTKKSDKKGGGGGSSAAAAAAGGVAKKRNAVDFLNRMNQNGSPSTERVSLLETLKLSAATEQQKKSSSSSGKGDGRKDAGGSGSKKAAAASTPPGRRNVGRPPKRAAAPPTPPPSKRAKDDKPATRKRGKK
uniref:Bromo domain-containing protein n=1 Tax=Oryza brachyantha TaxID=4533 RepID=J3MUB5_ORYBR